jgi:rhamnulokinase
VLLNEKDQIVGETVAYRDSRTQGMDDLVYRKIPLEKLYERTGIQRQIFNTIYQLMAVKTKQPRYLEEAKTLLMIPDYFNFLLTGIKKSEYTNATTTQLVNVKTKNWDDELLDILGYKRELFQKISMAGESLGSLSPEIQKLTGFNCEVLLPATHDTASAVAANPAVSENNIYLSSGTWSLMGIESQNPNCSPESMNFGFTNEGGYNYHFRFLKNIMGLWMVQSIKKEAGDEYSFDKLCEMAADEDIDSIVDCQNDCFLSPPSMIKAIQDYCEQTGQAIPKTPGQLAAVTYHSLAHCYANTVKELEELTNIVYPVIHIIGGGAKDDYLNTLTARLTGKTVYAGPVEAAAIGNILVQMLSKNELESLAHARKCVYRSFEIKEFKR